MLARLAIAIEDEWHTDDTSLVVGLDDRTSQSVFNSRRDGVLLYRHVAKTFIMFLGLGRIGGFTVAAADRLIWRFDELRRFPAPVISDAELQAPRIGRMLTLSPERFAEIVEQGTTVRLAGKAVQEAGAVFEGDRGGNGPQVYVAIHDEVLRRWDHRCAITGRKVAPGPRPHPELRVVEIRPRRLGGPLHVANYLPMLSIAEPPWRSGAISVGPQLDFLAVLDRLEPELLEAMRPEGRLLVPDDPALWPAAEHLAYHRMHIFGG